MKVEELFEFKTGKLPALELTEEGEVPLVYGTTKDNGVVKFVKVDDEEHIFTPPLITVSYLGTAFVQLVPFTTSVVDKSNIIILKNKKEMSLEEMYYYAVLINRHAKFGFHYGRRMNMSKLKKLDLLTPTEKIKPLSLPKYIPPQNDKVKKIPKTKFKFFNITELFDLSRGDFHAIDKLDEGSYPTISRATFNNGIVGHFDKPDNANIYSKLLLTVSTTSGTAFVQLQDFIATDNVVILSPKKKLKITTLFFIQLMINKASWRYSYGRQCYKEKLSKTNIYLPIDSNENIDEKYMGTVVENTSYYNFVKSHLDSK